MLLDPATLVNQPLHLAAIVAIILFGRLLIAIVTARLLVNPPNTALTIGSDDMPIGAFWFVLRTLAISEGLSRDCRR